MASKNSADKWWATISNKNKYGGYRGTNLTIKNIDTNDAGVYRCFSYDEIKRLAKYGSNITVVVPESPLLPSTTTAAITTTTQTTTTPITTTTPATTTTNPTTTTPTTTTTQTTMNRPPDQEKTGDDIDPIIPIVCGGIGGIVVCVAVFIICFVLQRRRVFKKRQESSYETNKIINAETHAYGITDTNHEYCNSTIKQTTATNNDIPLMEGDCLLEKYNVSELTKRIGDADLLEAKMRAEFMFLESNVSKVDVFINDYDEVVNTNKTDVSTAESKMMYIKRSADDIFLFSTLPDDGNIEQFWSMILNHNVENIIMMVQKNEKSSSFYPTQDDVFKVAMLEIEMQSSEKMNDNICLLRFSLSDKNTKTKKPVKIFKTVKWDDSDTHPPLETICSLLDKVKVKEGQPVTLVGSCFIATFFSIYTIAKGKAFLFVLLSVCVYILSAQSKGRRHFHCWNMQQYSKELRMTSSKSLKIMSFVTK
ncbi:uncharacterized protein LOC134683753 isoform X2 [Mytilus trossulus]|uniref:uncharacterized protein LOC134683753 isoform X2 n=1 Tax=Mytilus trossulus TaxID=6551 RepID=UPI003003C687